MRQTGTTRRASQDDRLLINKAGNESRDAINPRDGFLPDSLGDQREVGFGGAGKTTAL
ncbi:TPA: hypothetical protein ACX4EX_001622 [Yersinia enterocolitica]|uniref:hypothetical protein n=1 Tax=Yersinia enterocolitica TaxID=630 RepID=UPI0012B1966B|nr:hypothetical protein [Yersinia enterocolitica]HDL7350182.1 hypothetical protein [Yersinia enterocolitica]